MARDVLKTLAAVHEHVLDIVPRGIKPANILFDTDPVQSSRAHLTDFGLAQVAGTSQGLTKILGGGMGTPCTPRPNRSKTRAT